MAGAIVGGYQLHKIEEQEQLRVFTTYTKRYSDIVDTMPSQAYSFDESMFESVKGDIDKYDKLMKAIRKFFNLCSEEYYLAGEEEKPTKGSKPKKKIDVEVWELWKSGMVYHMKSKTFRRGWELVKKEGYSKSFRNFIDNVIIPAPLED